MDLKTVHLGVMVKKELKAQGRSVVWLARTINMERSGIYKLFDRNSFDVGLLIRISLVMNHDFFWDISNKIRENYDEMIELYLNYQQKRI
ncbi:MAG: XRE family transcriptional regulator [Bacteroidales bacterium]|nr:XRE family transcriptional regulator [Bacteroidales bacterium]